MLEVIVLLLGRLHQQLVIKPNTAQQAQSNLKSVALERKLVLIARVASHAAMENIVGHVLITISVSMIISLLRIQRVTLTSLLAKQVLVTQRQVLSVARVLHLQGPFSTDLNLLSMVQLISKLTVAQSFAVSQHLLAMKRPLQIYQQTWLILNNFYLIIFALW